MASTDHSAAATAASQAARFSARMNARFLTPQDLPALDRLEAAKWGEQQAASTEELAHRIESHPDLVLGAWCAASGGLMASLFLKPAAPDFWVHAQNWRDCVDGAIPVRTNTLFGISLSSRDAAAVDAILRFFWPHALKGGWRHIYLGSPIPGWRDWKSRHPGRGVVHYVKEARGRLPLDPQLRYYHARGFKEIVCVKRNYFPHERSHDHGVILKGTVPLSALSPAWRLIEPQWMHRITGPLARHFL